MIKASKSLRRHDCRAAQRCGVGAPGTGAAEGRQGRQAQNLLR
jgi:hypothetical protein